MEKLPIPGGGGCLRPAGRPPPPPPPPPRTPPRAHHRRQLRIAPLGVVPDAAPGFGLVVPNNPGYKSVLKDLKDSPRQLFIHQSRALRESAAPGASGRSGTRLGKARAPALEAASGKGAS